MKIIFSRKGFDSKAGGCASPLIKGRPLSLPIPTNMPKPTRYRDLNGPYAELVTDLTGGRLNGDSWCHLDPDIDPNVLPRDPGWRGALGQVGIAQRHLAKQQIAPGDVFVFWGLFCPVENTGGRWKFTGPEEHRIWGWLQVGEIIEVGANWQPVLKSRPWLRSHPHVRAGWKDGSVLYVASERLKLAGEVLAQTGSGVLSSGARLSSGSGGKSTWQVPGWLHPQQGGSGMTYHPPHRWRDGGILMAAARGQEFVASPQDTAGVSKWIQNLLQEK